MGYSFNRAIPMAVIGFVAGAGLVILLRALQSMDEVWDPQLGLAIGGLIGSIAFLWGIGAFSPQLAEHHVPEPVEDEFGNEIVVADPHHDEAEEEPRSILTNQVWVITLWVIVLFVGLLFFAALPGGLGYTVSRDPAANANANALLPIEIGGQTYYVSKLLALILFTAFTIISLYVAAGAIAAGLFGMSRGLTETKATGNQPLTGPALGPGGEAVAALPSGEADEEAEALPARRSLRARAVPIIRWIITFLILYVVFYEVAIGLVLQNPAWMRIILSLVNAALFAFLIWHTKAVLYAVGRIARFSAKVMRGIPGFLFQRD